MEPHSDRDIERLRAIARRVGELAHGRPGVVERLQRSWTDYIALHVGHVKERDTKELLQRKFAIGILEQGFLEEQPRKDHEPSWDWEIFRVRVPAKLRFEATTAKTPRALAKVNAKVAKAILKYIEDEDEIVGCSDPAKRTELFERREAATPDGEFEQRTFTVGFRPRPEFQASPHPLFCKWSEFQRLPIEIKETVAWVSLAVLHDAVSITPLLTPISRNLPAEPTLRHDTIVAWAVRECLDPTAGSKEDPPRLDPRGVGQRVSSPSHQGPERRLIGPARKPGSLPERQKKPPPPCESNSVRWPRLESGQHRTAPGLA